MANRIVDPVLRIILDEVRNEVERAQAQHKPLNSAHEGYAVIREELDELWNEVKKNRKERDPAAMSKEAVQVAAMCVRFINDVVLNDRIKEQS